MRLPGGLHRGGELLRDVAFKEPNGLLELAVAEASSLEGSLPARVSAVLAAALAHIGNLSPTPALAAELCVADRQFLMHRLAAELDLARGWRTSVCARCGERFDFEIDLRALPVREAGPGFPFARVETSAGEVSARVPTGADQEAVAGLPGARAEEALLARVLVGDALPSRLTAADRERVEGALEEASPAVITRLGASCPGCGHAQESPLDPYVALRISPARTLDDVHVLASFYHWAEQDILRMPRARRASYLARVERARGMVS